MFVGYIVLGHRIAQRDVRGAEVDRLGAAMLVALAAITPLGLACAEPTFAEPALLLAGAGVGVGSSVIPYVCGQQAMARLPRASFALLLALLPASAATIGAFVLRQWPTPVEIAGIALIAAGVGVHRAR